MSGFGLDAEIREEGHGPASRPGLLQKVMDEPFAAEPSLGGGIPPVQRPARNPGPSTFAPRRPTARPQQMPPAALYPHDDLGAPGLPHEDAADRYARDKAAKLLSRQTASRVAQQQLDRQVDLMTRRSPSQQEQEKAALTIQRYYRGHRVRKTLPPRTVPFSLHTQQQQAVPAGPGVVMPSERATPDQQLLSKVRFGPGTQFEPRRALPTVPIIDIDKMPKYGSLAQPLPRAERRAGTYIEYDRASHTFVKNRELLREALEHKRGYLESRPVLQWAEFTARQKERYVPVVPDAHRRVLPETQGYRLRILKVADMPINTTFDGRTFEFQLSVSLYDEAYGTFYGNTCYSMSDTYDRGRAAQRNAIDLDMTFDVYWHTTVSDPRCMAVVEVAMLERMLDGVVKGRYSLGWAMLPLFRVYQTPLPPGAPLSSGVQLDDVPGRPLAVPLMAGTPRYLLFRNVFNENLRPPKVIPNASILFQAEAYPAMEPYIPLLPENFLVTYSDVVPGLRRFDPSGALSTTPKTVISTLASPMLAPTYSVMLRRMQLALPTKLHDLLMALDARHGMATGYVPPPGTAAAASPIYQAPSTGSLTYTLRVSVHNGRTFVGPAYELTDLTALDVPGWKVLQVPSPHPVFDYVMADVMVAIVVELLATPPQAPPPPGLAPLQYLLGHTSFVPFSHIREDGSGATVAVGVHRYTLSPARPLVLRDQPPLAWRAMLGDMMRMEVPQPLLEFQLFETARTPILPPLKKVFAVIEAQRDEEAELGDQPLEELLQPVMVPEEIVPPPEINEVVRDAREPPLLPEEPQGLQFPLGDMEGSPPGLERVPSMDVLRRRSRSGLSLAGSQRDQGLPPGLADLTAAMQRQLELLTRAVDELKDERKSLRNSLLTMRDRGGAGAGGQDDVVQGRDTPAAAAMQRYQDAQRGRRGSFQLSPEELQRFLDMAPTTHHGDPAAFSGAQVPEGSKGLPGTAPSRVLMQQLHDAGMLDALPEDVRTLLARRGPPRGPSTTPIDLAIEARDPRLASDIVLQFLAYRHHDTLNAPTALKSIYLTFQFYHFPPTTTHPALLAPAWLSDEATGSTCVLLSADPAVKGAGLVLKYSVDGGAEALPTGTTAAQAGLEAAMAFAQYLGAKSLYVDVWDGESLLQIGTASIELQPLLRQGRDFAELLVEVPIMQPAEGTGGDEVQGLGVGQQPPVNTGPDSSEPGATIISRGSLVLRALNLARDSRNSNAALQPFDDAHNKPSRKRVRARSAWEVAASPIARELAGAVAGGPQAPHAASDPVRVRSSGLLAPPGEELKLRILETSHRKSARVQQYHRLAEVADDTGRGRDTAGGGGAIREPPGGGGGGREDQFRRVQKQLLADVAGARSRRKHDFILEQLRRNMVTRRVVRPAYGEVLVYEYEFQNPYSHEQTFDLVISSPSVLSVLTRSEDYRALRAANARFLGTVSQPVGPLEQELMQGNRIYLQAHERITLPFRLQSFDPPEAYKQSGPPLPDPTGTAALATRGAVAAATSTGAAYTSSPGANAAGGGGGSGSGGVSSGQVISVELLSTREQVPVSVLELQVVPRPLIVDRTFRYYQPERQLLRATLPLRSLPGGGPTGLLGAPGALRHACAACSHPDVILGLGSGGMGGGPERDQLYIKYKVGPAPEVVSFYVLLYLDRLMARPVEVWRVFVHSLRAVDMRAVIGQTATASVVVRGVVSRRVAAYTSHPDELLVSPESFVLVGGALTELLLSFRPVSVGLRRVVVHLVDSESRELVYALLVAAEAQGPIISRTFEVELPVGSVANKKITYTNPYHHYRTFTLRSNQPWLVHFSPPRLQLPAGATRPVGLTFDARAATPGVLDVLVFVNDDEDKTEEAMKIRVRIYK